MMPPATAPFGTWKSPITARMMTEGAVGIGSPRVDGERLYWLESRPSEAGRTVLVRRTASGVVTDLTPAPFNVRTRAHEYGGGSLGVGNGVVVFANFADQRVYRLDEGADPRPITPEGPLRYADFDLDSSARRAICVREDHRNDGEPVNALVALDPEGNGDAGRVVASGADFYAAPRFSPDGRQLAWLSWDHPNMPWDGTFLWVADIAADGVLTNAHRVAGGADVSVFQPEWSRWTGRSTSSTIPLAGGTCTVGATAAREPAVSPAGGVRPAPVAVRDAEFRISGRRTPCLPGDRGRRRAACHCRPSPPGDSANAVLAPRAAPVPRRPARFDRGLPFGADPAQPVGPGHGCRRGAETGNGDDRRRGLHFGSGSHGVPHRGGVVGPRILLPASQSTLCRSGGGAAAPDRALPRRPHGGHQRRVHAGHPVLDQPRLRRRRRKLWRQYRLWAAPIGSAWTGGGASSTWTTASTLPDSSRTRAGRTRTA